MARIEEDGAEAYFRGQPIACGVCGRHAQATRGCGWLMLLAHGREYYFCPAEFALPTRPEFDADYDHLLATIKRLHDLWLDLNVIEALSRLKGKMPELAKISENVLRLKYGTDQEIEFRVAYGASRDVHYSDAEASSLASRMAREMIQMN